MDSADLHPSEQTRPALLRRAREREALALRGPYAR